MTTISLEDRSRATIARWAVMRAGALTLEYFRKGVSVETKADQTPVTVADREAEQLLRDRLAREFPGDGFLGEEYGEELGTSGYKWIIDPIDATKNFVRGIPLFATLLGLERDGRLVAGFVYVPAQDRLYHAVRDEGAFCNDRPLKVSTIDRLEQSQLFYSSIQWFDRAGVSDVFLDLARRAERTRGFGDFHGHVLVAEGAGEAMLEPILAPWDIAGFKPIVEEAGGIVTDWNGVDTIYGTGCISANPAIHRLLMERLGAGRS